MIRIINVLWVAFVICSVVCFGALITEVYTDLNCRGIYIAALGGMIATFLGEAILDIGKP